MPTGSPIRGRRTIDAPRIQRVGNGVVRETFRRARNALRGVEDWDDAIRQLRRTRTKKPRRRATTRLIRRAMERINVWHRLAFVRANRRYVPNLFGLLRRDKAARVMGTATRRTVRYLERLPKEYRLNLLRRLERARRMKRTFNRRNLIRLIQQSETVTRNRIRLISTDQTYKVTADLNRHRSMLVNVELYEWRTQRDERVRPTHAENEGRVFRWDSAPVGTGHPGTEPNCRCVALPVHRI